MHKYKLRFADQAQADLVLDPILSHLRIGDYHRHDIGIHTECLAYGEEGECLESLTWDGWHVDIVSSVEIDIPEQYRKYPTPEEQIHAFFN